MPSTDPTDPRRLLDLTMRGDKADCMAAIRSLAMVEPPRKDRTFTRDDILVEERLGVLLHHYQWKHAA